MICSLEVILQNENGNGKSKLWRKKVSILSESKLRELISMSRDDVSKSRDAASKSRELSIRVNY